MNPIRLFLQYATSNSLGERVVAITLFLLAIVAVVLGAIYGYHHIEKKQKKRMLRRRHRQRSERHELKPEDVEGDVW